MNQRSALFLHIVFQVPVRELRFDDGKTAVFKNPAL